MKKIAIGSIAALSVYSALVLADVQHLDDVIITQSLCVGQDCSNGESFGFDTLRLKENNLRIKFQDTSTSASFPSNDWQLTANDSSNGGANRFSIDDITGSKTPFTVEAGAPTNSLYVDDGGRIGFGTATPVVNLHVKEGNSPTLRLEQDGSSGFASQTWDVAGNEANFFIRDTTNGSKLPFKIKPGAPTGSIFVAADGDIGLGTESPDAKLNVEGASASTIISDTATGSADVRTLLTLNSEHGSNIKFEHRNNAGKEWTVGTYSSGNGFLISRADTADGNADPHDNYNLLLNDNQFVIRNMASDELMRLTNTQLVVNGTVVSSSSRTVKDNIVSVDSGKILNMLSKLAIKKWNYINDGSSIKHIGPIAEEFYELFGLGSDDKHIASLDTSGIALAAIQALNEEVKDKNSKIESLEKQNKLLNERLALIEKTLEQLSSK
ncbi:tail fiber domain-containing protein [Aliikangiella coralliicola]|uniref:Tail fiber domain-containing protein n=1 Tax=Aliikangiella coralliicola TaxID=2592383 RepID=A0A545TSN5_9GAMM|nr:tail fiber domain-containing protein [Aliikangiella coralliicola]TQV80222.1 tail fiber domain-containing protein [Aliikangiella coralliicola]